ncbi:uncharacterized protein [Triticum aestivum]|uniref:uncharacterized protein n=1 Tax=Triticum aestivum TaxID=4565 RepID=UPI001D0031ED|nr:uncharacterized protein LOC123040960 [Triticum aestivum]
MQLLHGLATRFDTIRTILGDTDPLPPFAVTRSRLDLAEYNLNLHAAEAGSAALTSLEVPAATPTAAIAVTVATARIAAIMLPPLAAALVALAATVVVIVAVAVVATVLAAVAAAPTLVDGSLHRNTRRRGQATSLLSAWPCRLPAPAGFLAMLQASSDRAQASTPRPTH